MLPVLLNSVAKWLKITTFLFSILDTFTGDFFFSSSMLWSYWIVLGSYILEPYVINRDNFFKSEVRILFMYSCLNLQFFH